MADTFERVKKIIVDRLDVEESRSRSDSFVQRRLGGGLLDVVELVMELEDEFDMEISDEEAEKISTVQEVIDYIESHQ